MNRKVLLLNVALLALLVLLGWTLRVKWQQTAARERQFLAQAAKLAVILPPPPPAPITPALPADFLEVAQRTLFTKDRNPTVIVEVPAPKPEPPMPTLPIYHGQMSFGEPVVLLSYGSEGQKSYRVGQKVGEFTVLAFTRDAITLEWNSKKIERKLAELTPKEPQRQAQDTTAVAAPAAPAVTSLARPAAAAAELRSPSLGTDMGGGFRACVPGDTAPTGTVLDGYKKVVTQSLMGQTCRWEKVN